MKKILLSSALVLSVFTAGYINGVVQADSPSAETLNIKSYKKWDFDEKDLSKSLVATNVVLVEKRNPKLSPVYQGYQAIDSIDSNYITEYKKLFPNLQNEFYSTINGKDVVFNVSDYGIYTMNVESNGVTYKVTADVREHNGKGLAYYIWLTKLEVVSNEQRATSKPSVENKNETDNANKNNALAKQSGWSGSSYYQDGVKITNKWIFDKNYNSYFYLDASGNYVQNAWVGNYYLKSGGYMAKGEWVYDKNYGSYYYLTSEGSYAHNTWVGNYYLKSNGKMAKSEWIYDKNYDSYYYLTSEGSYARNTWIGNYYLKSNGKMAKGEWVYDKNYGSYYYLTSEGSYARNTWVGNYYLKSNGKMAKSEWVDGGRYYVGANGLWENKASTNSEHSAALEKAKSYNSLFHMSKKRMYRQLTSEFDKFSNDAAQYAIDHLQADYKYNALFNAKNYRKLFNMSKSRLINQLTSSIDGFTEEEANYAIDHLDD